MKPSLLCVVLGVAASLSWADQLVITGTVKEGTFQKFENGKFEFMTTKGRFTKQGAMQVTKLVLDKPMKVTYLLAGTKKEEEGELQGFEKKAFNFSKGGQTVSIPLAKIKTLGRALEFEGAGEGGGGGEGGYPIPAINIDDLAQGELTPQQKTGLDRFSKAKKTFDAFVTESAAMVKEMDQLKDAKRQELLNKLRERKEAEQPLKNELTASFKALTNLFPEEGQN